MNVGIITTSYPNEGNTSNGIFVHNQVKGLKKNGENVIVLYLDFRSIRNKRPWGLSHYEYEGVKVYRFSLPIGPIYPVIYSLMPKALWILYCYAISLDKKKLDILHAHFWRAGIAAVYLKKKLNIPCLITEHGSDVLNMKFKARELKLIKKVYSDSNMVIAVSNALIGKISQLSMVQTTNIPNLVPEYMFIERQPRHDGEFNFVSVGNLVESKRFDLTIRAVKELINCNYNVHLYIAGEGPLKEKLERLAGTMYGSAIHFLGRIDNRQLPTLYQKMDCFVLPSDYETFGVAYIEANATGIPVIATKCGGPEEIVKPGVNGVLVDIGDYDCLLDEMKHMIGNYKKYDLRKIQLNTESKYGEKMICNRISEIYRSLD